MNVSKVFKVAAIAAAVLSVFGVVPKAESLKTTRFDGVFDKACEQYPALLQQLEACEHLQDPAYIAEQTKQDIPVDQQRAVQHALELIADQRDENTQVCARERELARIGALICEESPGF